MNTKMSSKTNHKQGDARSLTITMLKNSLGDNFLPYNAGKPCTQKTFENTDLDLVA